MRLKTIIVDGTTSLAWDLIISLTAFSIPLFVVGPQWLTGSLVNCLLILAVSKLSRWRLIPVLILPSLGAFLHGVLFGPYTLFLFYFLPFIWIGNTIFISVFIYTKNKIFPFAGVFLGAITKSLFLFTVANCYFKFQIVPKMFLSSMGKIQFTTALLGGLIALVILGIIEKKHE